MAIEDDPDFRKIKKETHKLFIHNLMKGLTQKEAYRIAFPNSSNRTQEQQGYELKKKYAPLIERYTPIPPLVLERVASQTLTGLSAMAFADVGDLLNEEGKPRTLKELPLALRQAITEVVVEGNRVSWKLGGKLKSLELLAKVCRIDNAGPEININITNEEDRANKINEILVRAQNRLKTSNGEGEG